MRVHEVRLLRADRPDHVTGHPRADVGAAADAAIRHVDLLEPVVEALRVAALDVEPEEARIDAGGAEGGEEDEQMPFGAADAPELVEVEHSHASSRRYTASTASVIRPIA